ncbi:uncharacterized protein F4807DRAFT_148849 [Annulohypoxylon truncatum]|uniref:uncharacterized protein n=1 Tax=Annulohypoxylon truncatum TaxID=327061 RepID=UPI002008499D|nr:uncharacterized protein F4807DRAFT_148849 [Annulohypoxylon truncatum]KAI1208355.1 hypothetical protein F4807DRAFT_148849 [Annulohypoxylon truncatum]
MTRVNGLEVYTYENGDDVPVPENSERFQIVEAISHLALAVHESPEGRRRLVQVATEVVRQRNHPGKGKPPVPHIYNHPIEEMPHWIDVFLRRMRANFPGVRLNRTDGEAAAQKKTWGTDMNRWDPKEAGFFEFQIMIINNMIHARRLEPNVARLNYSRFKFQMVISVAHEMVHLLVGYLTGSHSPPTPPGVTLTPFGNTVSGESGRYWESILLGGVVEFYQDRNDPLEARQAGVPWLIQDGRNNVSARMVSMDYINRFLNGNFLFPVRTSSSVPETDRNGLRGISPEMADVRARAARRRNNPADASLQVGSSSANSTMSYRRPPQGDQRYAGYFPPQDPYGSSQAGPSYTNSSTSRYDYDNYNRGYGGYGHRR